MFALIKTCTTDTAYAGCKALMEKCQRQMNYKLSILTFCYQLPL